MDSSSSWEDTLFLPGGEMTATMLLARLTVREKKQSSLHSSDPFSKGTKPQIGYFVSILHHSFGILF